MFRKPKQRKIKNAAKKNLRKEWYDYNSSNVNEDEDQNDNVGESIRKTIQKHKLLSTLPMTTGKFDGDSGLTTTDDINTASVNNYDRVIEARAVHNSNGLATELSFLASKHKDNMESFIVSKIGGVNKKNNYDKGRNIGTTNTTYSDDDPKTKITSDEDLHRQLEQEITSDGNGSAKALFDDKVHVSGGSQGNNNSSADSSAIVDDDKTTGVLVGTGIVEVILPEPTKRSSTSIIGGEGSSMYYVRNKTTSYMSSAVPYNNQHKHAIPDTTPKPFAKFRKSYNNSFDVNYNNNEDHQQDGGGLNNGDIAVQAADSTRSGFHAFMGKSGGVGSEIAVNNFDHYNGEYEWQRSICNKNNIKRKWTGKSRDDQAYSHFIKTAIAGKRMR